MLAIKKLGGPSSKMRRNEPQCVVSEQDSVFFFFSLAVFTFWQHSLKKIKHTHTSWQEPFVTFVTKLTHSQKLWISLTVNTNRAADRSRSWVWFIFNTVRLSRQHFDPARSNNWRVTSSARAHPFGGKKKKKKTHTGGRRREKRAREKLRGKRKRKARWKSWRVEREPTKDQSSRFKVSFFLNTLHVLVAPTLSW